VTPGDSIYEQAPTVPQGAPIVTTKIHTGSGQGQSIVLRRAASLLGTKPGCKLVLKHPQVNRRHCVIVNTGAHVILRDLATGGKTLRNGLKVEQEILDDEDTLTIGPWELGIKLTTPMLSGSSDSPVIVDLEPDPTILVIEDPTTGKLIKLPREVTVLGRNNACDITVEDREVSSVHAVLFSYLNKPAIFDLVSENGTWVNGQRAVFARLNNGDEISLGTYKLRFRSNAPQVGGKLSATRNGDAVLKPAPFGPPPEGTLSDFIDFSAESKLQ
jgi:pSer/pThr/pTyr-binding forkhead associated (FHA) protein